MKKYKNKLTDQQIIKLLKNDYSIAYILKIFGGSYKRIKKLILDNNIEYKEFRGMQWKKPTI